MPITAARLIYYLSEVSLVPFVGPEIVSMIWLDLALISIGLSGIPGVFIRGRTNLGQWIGHILHTIGSIIGVTLSVAVLLGRAPLQGTVGSLGGGFPISFNLDPLAAAFVLPILIVTNFSSLFGLNYWQQAQDAPRAWFVNLCFGFVSAGLVAVVVSGDMLSFLFGWEVMALAAFFLITAEDGIKEVREAGFIYFVATHLSTLLLFVLFCFIWNLTGSHTFSSLGQVRLEHGSATVLFILALLGFGLKAGVFPGHFWLPPAHASAPTHVSAVMSGVLIKVGIYGLMRMILLMLNSIELWWGVAVLSLGIVSSILGVAFALGQHDLKRLLAYHSIENIGIIMIGLGVMLIGFSHGNTPLIILGLTGALLHVWNHALFKGLLFLSAGAVVHATGTRELDHLGGLGKSMPITMSFFLLGAVAICGLPPLNGFISELLIYLGLLRGLSVTPSYLMVGGCLALALIGGLALGCFVKAFGTVFLGGGRSEHAARGHEASLLMRCGMGGLALGCLIIGLAPVLSVSLLAQVVSLFIGSQVLPGQLTFNAPALKFLAVFNPVIAVVFIGSILIALRLRQNASPGVTWDCGYVRPSYSMQYTASSFAQMFVFMLGRILGPRSKGPTIDRIFPGETAFKSSLPDIVVDRAINPIFRRLQRLFVSAHAFQGGNVQVYVFYIFATFVLMMIFCSGG